MYDQLFPDSTEQAFSAKLLRPVEPQSPRFSTWGLLTAPAKGLTAGAAQGMASTADVGKAIADKLPASMEGPFGKIPLVAGIQAAFQTGADIVNPKEGQFTSEVGTSLRNVARDDIMPDPLTTHASERVVADLFRVGGKAITAAVTMGNIPGAVTAGVEEGFTMADELARQGVDVKTRTKVGAVNAALNAGAFALPVAGKTWAQTGALALAGGPVAFIGQNMATKKILEDADYTRQADQYDPFDPVGLTLSTLVPFGFGALAMRGRAKAKTTTTPEVEDAARVSLLRENVDGSNPAPNDMAAADAHVAAYTKAMEQMAEGRKVEVADVAPRFEMESRTPVIETPEFRNWFGESKVVDEQGKPMVVYHGTYGDVPAFDIKGTSGINFGKTSEGFAFFTNKANAYPDSASDYATRLDGPNVAPTVLPVHVALQNPFIVDATGKYNAVAAFDSQAAKIKEAITSGGHDGVIVRYGDGSSNEVLVAATRPEQIKSAIGNSGKFDPNSASLTDSKFTDWAQQVNSTLEEMRGEMSRLRQTEPVKQPGKSVQKGGGKQKAGTKAAPEQTTANDLPPGEPRPQETKAGKAAGGDVASDYVQAESKRIAMEHPDMPVLLEGMDQPMPLSDVMAQIKQDLQADLADVPLLQVAAECFIQSGGGIA